MACTWASKVNGILTVVAIGIAVLIDLWDILDVRKGHSMVRDGEPPTFTRLISTLCRSTSRSTSLPEQSVLSCYPLFFTWLSSGFISLSLRSLVPVIPS